MQFLILASVFVASLGVIIATWLFFNRRRLSAAAEARARLAGPHQAAGARTILRDARDSDLPIVQRVLAGRELTGTLNRMLEQAGSTLNAGAFVLLVVTSAVAGGFLLSVAATPLLAPVGALVGATAPLVWLAVRRGRRASTIEQQLPDAIDMLVNSMRAGYSFQQAMNFVGNELEAPLGTEFARFYNEQRLGVEVRTALLSMQERIGGMDAKMLVTAVLIQRESGGNLSEVLGNIGKVVRERLALRGEIATLTSQGKLSARIMSGLPLFVFVAVRVMDPAYMNEMTSKPMGRMVLLGAAASVMMGYLTMMRIADVEV